MAKKKKKPAKRKKASAKDLKARKDVRGGLAATRIMARRPLGFTTT